MSYRTESVRSASSQRAPGRHRLERVLEIGKLLCELKLKHDLVDSGNLHPSIRVRNLELFENLPDDIIILLCPTQDSIQDIQRLYYARSIHKLWQVNQRVRGLSNGRFFNWRFSRDDAIKILKASFPQTRYRDKTITTALNKLSVQELVQEFTVNQLLGVAAYYSLVIESIPTNGDPSRLSLTGLCGLTPDDFFFAVSMGALESIKSLDLSNNDIGDEGMKALSNEIAKRLLPHLEVLNLGSNKIGRTGIESFADAIKPTTDKPAVLPSLVELHLGNNLICKLGMRAFATAITPTEENFSGALGKLKVLDLDNNQIDSDGLIALSGAISKYALVNLQELSLRENNIGDVGIITFANAIGPKYALSSMPFLENLYLSDNDQITPNTNRILEAALVNHWQVWDP
jgi:hypothetical protein